MRTKSKKPSKQRKYEKNVPFHEAHKLMSVNLSRELREQKGFRSIPVRPKDEVLITRGKHKNKKGKVTHVFPQKQYVFVEKVTNKKTNSEEVPAKIHPSNLQLIKFGKHKDKKRLALINRRVKDTDELYTEEDFIDEDEDVINMDDEEFEETEMSDDEFELEDDESGDESTDAEGSEEESEDDQEEADDE